MFVMSCNTAPWIEVITAMRVGKVGIGRFLDGLKRPSLASFRFNSSSLACNNPVPTGSTEDTLIWRSPRLAYIPTLPSQMTCAPSSKNLPPLPPLNMTQRSDDSLSRSVKYRWPDGGERWSATSPVTRTFDSRGSLSIRPRMSWETSVTDRGCL